jgi:flagellar motility protein MotE (MotC chaperone)
LERFGVKKKSRPSITVRLLPVLTIVLLLALGLHVGRAWTGLSLSFGARSEAQTADPAPPVAPAGAADAEASPGADNTVPGVAPMSDTASEVPVELVPSLAGPEDDPPAADPAGAATNGVPTNQATGAPAETTVPLAADAASEGGSAQIESEAAVAPGSLDDPLELSDEEIDVLQQLAKRREELELRSRRLDEREALVAAAEGRMEQKMAELRALQATVEDVMNKRSDAEEAQLQSLVKIYENMKPKAAAQVFEELDLDVLLEVVTRMNERKLAPILALVSPTRAKEVTYELAQRSALPISQ